MAVPGTPSASGDPLFAGLAHQVAALLEVVAGLNELMNEVKQDKRHETKGHGDDDTNTGTA